MVKKFLDKLFEKYSLKNQYLKNAKSQEGFYCSLIKIQKGYLYNTNKSRKYFNEDQQ